MHLLCWQTKQILFPICRITTAPATMVSVLAQVLIPSNFNFFNSRVFFLLLILIFWNMQERLLGAALGSILTGIVVFEQRKSIYKSISDNQSQSATHPQVILYSHC
jgi:hypothetical protein